MDYYVWFVCVVCVCTKFINYLASHSLTNNDMQNNATSFFSLFSGHNHSIIWLLFFGGGEAIFPPFVPGTGPNWYLVRAISVTLSIYN